jgi:hypothetical protein
MSHFYVQDTVHVVFRASLFRTYGAGLGHERSNTVANGIVEEVCRAAGACVQLALVPTAYAVG